MPEKRRSKSLEEVELELEYFGLTRQTAAAIVRLANTLKQTRKLRAAHIELLTPGRRLHPPSPLAQHVWNQSEIESLHCSGNEPEAASHNETSCSEATTVGLPSESSAAPETTQPSPFLDFSWLIPLISSGKDMNGLGDVLLSSMDPATLTDVASRVGDMTLAQEYPPSKSSNAIPPVEDGDDDTLHKKDDSKWW